MELPFNQQLWLALIDKGSLVLATIAGGLVVTRALERYKAHQSLQHAIAPERVKRVAGAHEQVATLMREIDSKAYQMAFEVSVLMEDAPLDPGTDPADALRRRKQFGWEKVFPQHEDALQTLNARAVDLIEVIDRQAFWIGAETHAYLRHQTLIATMASDKHAIRKAIVEDELRSDPFLEPITKFVVRRYPHILHEGQSRWQRIRRRLHLAPPLKAPKNVDELLRRMAK